MVSEVKKYVIMEDSYDDRTPIMVVDTEEQAVAKVKELEDNQPEYCEKFDEEVSKLYDRVFRDGVFEGSRHEEVKKGLKELEKKYPVKTDCLGNVDSTYYYIQCEYEPK